MLVSVLQGSDRRRQRSLTLTNMLVTPRRERRSRPDSGRAGAHRVGVEQQPVRYRRGLDDTAAGRRPGAALVRGSARLPCPPRSLTGLDRRPRPPVAASGLGHRAGASGPVDRERSAYAPPGSGAEPPSSAGRVRQGQSVAGADPGGSAHLLRRCQSTTDVGGRWRRTARRTFAGSCDSTASTRATWARNVLPAVNSSSGLTCSISFSIMSSIVV